MPRLSPELIKDEYKKWRHSDKETGFGPYMNEKYFLKDVDLIKELDTNMALLRLLKDHAQEEDTL
tara:strand:- start:3337 stop:3531 length:195 start_codon:yes stop_codon:yes gene_type:complete